MSLLQRAAVAALASAFALGCQPPQQEAQTPPPDGGALAATIMGETLSVAELDAYVKEKLFREETEGGKAAALYEVRKEALEELVRERVLEKEAASRNLSVEQLVQQEAEALGPVRDEEIAAFYEQNKSRVGDQTLENLTEPIRKHLEGGRRAQATEQIVGRADVQVALEPPRFQVGTAGPSLGPADARVTIVEFSDFQCPFCRRASDVVKALNERYPQDLRLVYRQFPLESIHPHARSAAEASLCANDQDRFWDYHDKLFENTRALAREDLVAYATELGLDLARFEACLSERTHRATVEADLAEASAHGVTGTPAFFVNGILMTGAQPVESFAEVIEAELQRLGGAESS